MERAHPSEDRISSLPRDVTDSILERLKFREAVRTSVLSRIWRNKWKTLSNITLGYDFADETKLEMVINRILLLHSSNIRKFYLIVPNSFKRVPDIIPLMYRLSINGIKDLIIFYDGGLCVIDLPSYLFSCPELTRLVIGGCIFKPPSDFSGFNCLVSLSCSKTQFKQGTFESLLSSCPLLERLALSGCTGIGHLVIDAPNLKLLHIKKYNDITFLCFKNTENVTSAYIQIYGSLKNTDQSQTHPTMLSAFTAFSRIEKLTLGDYRGSYLKLLAAGGVPLCLPYSLYHLKFLNLDFISFSNIYQISCALCLIRSCPNLQELHILGLESVDDDMNSVMSYLDQALDSHTSLYQLQIISINGVTGANPELEIIRFLLASSPALKTLNVKFRKGVVADVMLVVSTELLSFQRASTEAKVIVKTTN